MKRIFVVACCVALAACGTVAQTPATSPQHAVLVELFTSEGCSDCPPAEAVLAKINGKETSAGTPIIAIAEHITYFNNAWEDPFSDDKFTDRQKAYANNLNDDVFTPMAVVMGQHTMNGRDGHAILEAANATRNTAVTLHLLSAKRDGKKLTFTYSADGLPKGGSGVSAFVVDDTDDVAVPRGENKNTTLHHVFVVRTMENMGDVRDSAVHTLTLGIKPSKTPQHLVLVLQEPGVGKVLAVETAAIQ